MSNDLNPGGGTPAQSAAQILYRLIGAATLAAGSMLYGAGTSTLSTLPIGAANTVLTSSGTAPQWSTSLALTGTVASKQTTAAGISLDHNSATGNFTMRLSPANLTANRRMTVPDADFTVAGLSIAQTFTAANNFSSTVRINGAAAGQFAVITATDTAPATNITTTGWDSKHTVLAGNVTSATALGFGCSVNQTTRAAHLFSVNPSAGWGAIYSFASDYLWHVGTTARMSLDASGNLNLTTPSGVVTVGDGTSTAFYRLNQAAGGTSGFSWRTNGVDRWLFYVTNAESGSDAGCDLVFGRAFTDGGVGIDNPITITRAAGGNINIIRPISSSGAITLTSGSNGLTISKTTGTTLTVSSTQASSGTGSGSAVFAGGVGIAGACYADFFQTLATAGRGFRVSTSGGYVAFQNDNAFVADNPAIISTDAANKTLYLYGSGSAVLNMNLADGALTLAATTGTTLTVSSTNAAAIACSGGISATLATLTTGTITTSTPAINATQTWNAGGVTFTAWKLNVTNTASATASLLLDLQVGGVTTFSIRRDGLATLNGNATVNGSVTCQGMTSTGLVSINSASGLSIAQGTVSSGPAYLFDASTTWNNASATFDAFRFFVTDSASDINSRLFAVSGANRSFFIGKNYGIQIKGTTSGTSSTYDVGSFFADSSGTPAAGFGVAFGMDAESSDGFQARVGRISASLIATPYASFTGRMVLAACDYTGTTGREAIRMEADGTAAKIGFLGASAIARATMAAATGTATRTTFDTTTVTTAQLAERVKALIDDLRSYGLHG